MATATATTYLDYASTTRKILEQRWFGADAPGQWVPGDYWRTPTICKELVGAMELLGDTDSVATLESARQAGEPYIGSCAYYDDESVWGAFFGTAIAFMAAREPSLKAQYLRDAVAVHDDLHAGWTSSCAGGIWWQRFQDGGNFKAANSTLGYAETALHLHTATGDAAYLDDARAAWAWIVSSGLLKADGLVWGGLAADCSLDPTNVPVIALQGNPLTPLWELWVATRDDALLDAAQRIVDVTLATMTWPGTEIFCTPADAGWAGGSPDWRGQHGNETVFKGIFAGFLGPFAANLATVEDPARRAAAARYGAVLRANADALWANYPGHVFGMDWHTPTPGYAPSGDDQVDACLQFGAMAAFLAAARNPA